MKAVLQKKFKKIFHAYHCGKLLDAWNFNFPSIFNLQHAVSQRLMNHQPIALYLLGNVCTVKGDFLITGKLNGFGGKPELTVFPKVCFLNGGIPLYVYGFSI